MAGPVGLSGEGSSNAGIIRSRLWRRDEQGGAAARHPVTGGRGGRPYAQCSSSALYGTGRRGGSPPGSSTPGRLPARRRTVGAGPSGARARLTIRQCRAERSTAGASVPRGAGGPARGDWLEGVRGWICGDLLSGGSRVGRSHPRPSAETVLATSSRRRLPDHRRHGPSTVGGAIREKSAHNAP